MISAGLKNFQQCCCISGAIELSASCDGEPQSQAASFHLRLRRSTRVWDSSADNIFLLEYVSKESGAALKLQTKSARGFSRKSALACLSSRTTGVFPEQFFQEGPTTGQREERRITTEGQPLVLSGAFFMKLSESTGSGVLAF